MNAKHLIWVGAVCILAACSSDESQAVEVTRVITETVVVAGETIEVTRLVAEVAVSEEETSGEEAMIADGVSRGCG